MLQVLSLGSDLTARCQREPVLLLRLLESLEANCENSKLLYGVKQAPQDLDKERRVEQRKMPKRKEENAKTNALRCAEQIAGDQMDEAVKRTSSFTIWSSPFG